MYKIKKFFFFFTECKKNTLKSEGQTEASVKSEAYLDDTATLKKSRRTLPWLLDSLVAGGAGRGGGGGVGGGVRRGRVVASCCRGPRHLKQLFNNNHNEEL